MFMNYKVIAGKIRIWIHPETVHEKKQLLNMLNLNAGFDGELKADEESTHPFIYLKEKSS